jgi:hypothetical protein
MDESFSAAATALRSIEIEAVELNWSMYSQMSAS